MSIDPNLYAGALILAIGILLGVGIDILRPFAVKWLNHRTSLRQLALRKKTREDALQAQLHKQAVSQQTGAMPQVQPGQATP